MRSAECQVAAAVVLVSPVAVAVLDLLPLVDSGQPVLPDLAQSPADSDQVPASAPSVRGLPAFHLLLHRTGHFHRGPLSPTITFL
jgi:hypothetical protein